MKRRRFIQFFTFFPFLNKRNGFWRLFGMEKVIKDSFPIDFQWPVQEPFLFCVHHFDHYPSGNKNLGLDQKYFTGRNIGQDFELRDGFRLYHGKEIPGFPVHPHRGFETITIVRKGLIDHADSLGSAGRYGEGDVQWMTAGSGVQHSEMFPLLKLDEGNTIELFQIWLNLPKKDKMTSPDFKMIWSEAIPKIKFSSQSEISLINGEYNGIKFYQSPKKSWANNPQNEVNIFLVKMGGEDTFKMPASQNNSNRTLYFFEGDQISVNSENISNKKALYIDSQKDLNVTCNGGKAEFLYLEARPIGEAIVQYGPFVMNSKQEIFQAIEDFQKTQFGGWNWPRKDMIHGPGLLRFAKYPDGKVEKPQV